MPKDKGCDSHVIHIHGLHLNVELFNSIDLQTCQHSLIHPHSNSRGFHIKCKHAHPEDTFRCRLELNQQPPGRCMTRSTSLSCPHMISGETALRLLYRYFLCGEPWHKTRWKPYPGHRAPPEVQILYYFNSNLGCC